MRWPNQNKHPHPIYFPDYNDHWNKVATPRMNKPYNASFYIGVLIRRHMYRFGVKYHRNMRLRLYYRHWFKINKGELPTYAKQNKNNI